MFIASLHAAAGASVVPVATVVTLAGTCNKARSNNLQPVTLTKEGTLHADEGSVWINVTNGMLCTDASFEMTSHPVLL